MNFVNAESSLQRAENNFKKQNFNTISDEHEKDQISGFDNQEIYKSINPSSKKIWHPRLLNISLKIL